MRFVPWDWIFAAVAIFLVFATSYSDAASSEPLDLGGLTVDPPKNLDLTFQVIPSYDPKQNVLAGWDGKTLQYVIGRAKKLPPEWLDANKYLAAFVRDLRAASMPDTFESGRTGNYKSAGGLNGTYMEYSSVLRGQSKARPQVVHFLTDSNTAFIAFVTPVDETARDKMLDESIAIFRTAAFGGIVPMDGTVAMADDSDAKQLFGKWVAEEHTPDGRVVVSHTELKSDLTFTSDMSIGGKSVFHASGLWSVNGKELTWNYMHSSPELPESARTDTDEIEHVDQRTLVTLSKRSGQRHHFSRENSVTARR